MGLEASEGGQPGRRGPRLRNGPLRDSWPPSRRVSIGLAPLMPSAQMREPTKEDQSARARPPVCAPVRASALDRCAHSKDRPSTLNVKEGGQTTLRYGSEAATLATGSEAATLATKCLKFLRFPPLLGPVRARARGQERKPGRCCPSQSLSFGTSTRARERAGAEARTVLPLPKPSQCRTREPPTMATS